VRLRSIHSESDVHRQVIAHCSCSRQILIGDGGIVRIDEVDDTTITYMDPTPREDMIVLIASMFPVFA
jgi:hypothetical protein